MTATRSGRAALLRLLVSLFALSGLWWGWQAPGRPAGVDDYQFWVVGQVLGRPGVDVYADADRARIGAEFLERAIRSGDASLAAVAEYRATLETYSTPFLYALFRFLSSGDLASDLERYRLIQLACLALATLTLARLLGHSWEVALGAVALFSAGFGPFSSELRVGNVNSLQLAAVAAHAALTVGARGRLRDAFAGAFMGAAIAFKPNLAFVLALALANWSFLGAPRRALAQALGAAIGFALAVAVSTRAFADPSSWMHWIAALKALPADIVPVRYGNFAPARLLGEWSGLDMAIPVALVACGLPLAAFGLRRRRGLGPCDDATVIAAGCLLVVLATRLAWLHYYVLAIPALLALARPDAEAEPQGLAALALVTAALVAYSADPLVVSWLAPSTRVQGLLVVVATLGVYAAMLPRLAGWRGRVSR